MKCMSYMANFQVGTDKGIYFASSDGVLACSQAFRSGNWVHGDFDVQVIYRLLKSLLSDTNEEEVSWWHFCRDKRESGQ